MALRIWFAFILMVFSSETFASAQEVCTPLRPQGQVPNIYIAECTVVCNGAFNNKNVLMANYFLRQCEKNAKDSAYRETVQGKLAYIPDVTKQAILKCLPLAAQKAALDVWDLGVTLVTGLVETASNIGQEAAAKQKEFERCSQNPECKRTVARTLIEFNQRKSGSQSDWVIPDSDVDQKIANRSLNDLLKKSMQDRLILREQCRKIAASSKADVPLEEVFKQHRDQYPFCLSLMKPPASAPKAAGTGLPLDKLSKTEQLAVGVACFGEDFVNDICSDVAKVAIPLPLVGPQTGLLKDPAKAAVKGAATAAEASALKSAAETKTAAASAERSVSETTKQAREAFMTKYKDLVFSSEESNRKFIATAKSVDAGQAEKQFFVVENRAMKTLNDTTGDKNLVTSLTNFHKEAFTKRLAALQKKYPQIKLEEYNDFKATFSGADRLPPDLQRQFKKDLDAILVDSNTELAAKMKSLDVNVPEAGDPTTWFKGGMGSNVEEAASAARRARQVDEVKFLEFDSPEVRGQLQTRLGEVDQLRQSVVTSPQMKGLVDRKAGKNPIPKEEVFDLARKHKSKDALAYAIREKYGLKNFGPNDAELLLKYADAVDEFSPTILIPKREVVNLDEASLGGSTADFLGLGSANQHGTARALAGQSDLQQALRATRAEEARVTSTFQAKMKRFKEIAGENVRCSGDDCVQIASSPLSRDQKVKLLAKVASDPQTRRIRIAFVGPNVSVEQRMQLATHGELIEKSLRKELNGKVDYKKLEKITFGLDMRSAQMNEGTVDLIIGKSAMTLLTPGERRQIQEAFAASIKKYNSSGATYVKGSAMVQEQKLRLVPGIGFVEGDREDNP